MKEIKLNSSEYSFSPTDFVLDSIEVGKWIGYDEKGIPSSIKEQIEDVLYELKDLINIKGGFRISNRLTVGSGSLYIENLEFHTKKIISRNMKKATSVAIFACTVGEEVSMWASQSLKKDAVRGYLADVAASVMAEKTAQKIQEKIEQFAQRESEFISNRYSPGYCGWSVADQHLLFSLLPEDFCGITLNEAALMHPIKSVSGIVGIGKEIEKNPYQCNICDVTDCIMSPISLQPE